MNNENIKLGRMRCPNCGMERGTDMCKCICGYNPLTNKVEKSPLEDCKPVYVGEVNLDERFSDSYFGINELVDEKETEFDKKKLKFYVNENVNWLQYVLIEILLNFDFSESNFKEFKKYVQLGIDNKIYNGVPRLGQGNKITDLAPATKKHFDSVFGEEIKDWRYNVIEDILIGWYDIAKMVIDKI